MEWIDVDDRLPKDREDVIIAYNDLALSGWYISGAFFFDTPWGCIEKQEGVEYWMAMPPAPECKPVENIPPEIIAYYHDRLLSPSNVDWPIKKNNMENENDD
jgi:hypothetical protein